MINKPRRRKTVFTFFLVTIVIASFGLPEIHGQDDDPLTLAEVLTALQSKSSGTSLSAKNVFITQRVRERGVTFRSSTEITNELRRAGATEVLISTIRDNGPKTATPANTGSAENVIFDKLWISYNVVEDEKKGMRVHCKFTVRNMKDTPLYLSVRFQKENGDILESSNVAYRNKGGQLAVFRKLTPAYDAAVYNDFSVFVPYKEIVLPVGKHNLKVDADIIYENGDFLKHLKIHPIIFTQGPAPTNASTPRVKFDRLWIQQNVRQRGLLGMRVHVKFTAYNLRNKAVQLAIGIEKRDGGAVNGINRLYRSKTGTLTVYRRLNMRFNSSVFNDVAFFIPYKEFDVRPPTADLRIHADLLYPTNQNLHLTYYNFRLSPGAMRIVQNIY